MCAESVTASPANRIQADRSRGTLVTVEIPVRFAETDAMGIVHHANYVTWFELGRIAWLDAVGMPYVEVAAGGNHFAVTGISVKYRHAARFGDTVELLAGLEELRSRKVAFFYELRNKVTCTLLALGRSEHICVDLDGRMAQIPPKVLDRIRTGMNGR